MILSRLMRRPVALLVGVMLASGSFACAARNAPVSVPAAPSAAVAADVPPTGQTARLRVGGEVREPRILSRTEPVYPRAAMSNKTEGSVIIEAVIGKDGSVTDVKVLRSSPEFDQSALDAVRSWKYSPTLVKGEPVEVMMTVTVNFRLR